MNEDKCTEISLADLKVGAHFTVLKQKKTKGIKTESLLVGRVLECKAKCEPFIITKFPKGTIPFVIDTRRTTLAAITPEYIAAAT